MTKFETYQSTLGRINYVLFLIAVASLPFPQIVERYALVAWLIGWVLELRWLKVKDYQLSVSNLRLSCPLLLFGIWYVWRALSGLWSPDQHAWSFMMERYLMFGLLVPVAIYGVNECYDWRMIGKVLVISGAAAVPFYILLMTALYYHPDWAFSMGYKEWIGEGINWWDCFVVNSSFIKHRLFLCTIEIIAAVVATQIWQGKPHIWLPIVLTMLSLIVFTGSRQSILTLAAVIIIYAILHIKGRYRWLYGAGIVITGLCIGIAILFMHPRMRAMLADGIALEQLQVHEPRVGIWNIALSSPKDYFWFGLGGGQSHAYMMAKYDEYQMGYFKYKQYHVHNQYLEEWIELGIFGVIFFVIAWISIIYCSRGIGRQTAIYFVTICMLCMLTDCLWGKFDGIAIWAVLMLYIYLQSRADHLEQSRDNIASQQESIS